MSVKRVCLVGAESTGKTTLAAGLASHYNTVWVPEYARAFLKKRNGARLLEFMVPIALGQSASVIEIAKKANGVFCSDSCLLATSIWSERYFGGCDNRILDMVEEERYDLYILLSKENPWVADGLRDSAEYRGWIHERLLSELIKRK